MSEKKKQGKGKAIGNSHERDICYMLSNWWSHGEDDGIFWRSDTSGGRATTKKKKGIIEPDLFGDVTHRKPAGVPFIKFILIEGKKGYGTNMNPLDFFEPDSSNWLIKFWLQAEGDRIAAGRKWSWLIFRRTKKKILLMLNTVLFNEISYYDGEYEGMALHINEADLVIVNFKEFLDYCNPYTILEMANNFLRPKLIRR